MSVAGQIYEKAQGLPEPAQQTILDLVEKLARQSSRQASPKKRVHLPLIDSKEPGVLNLTNADIEELLA